MLFADKVFKNIELAGFFFIRVGYGHPRKRRLSVCIKYGYGTSVCGHNWIIISIIIIQSDWKQFLIRFRILHNFSHPVGYIIIYLCI